MNQYDSAISKFNRALQFNSKNVMAISGVGSAYRLQGNFTNVRGELEHFFTLIIRHSTYNLGSPQL
jgi:hypothetical protein